MSEKTNMTRVSLDIPHDYHKQLKAKAALYGKTFRQLILESLDKCICEKSSNKSGRKKKLDEIAEHELWVYDPANKRIVEHIEKGLNQKANIYRGSFAKNAK